MKRPAYKYVLAFADWCLINLAFIIAVSLHGKAHQPIIQTGFPFFSADIILLMFYSGICLLFFHYNNLYNISVILSGASQIVRLVKSVAYMTIGLVLLSFFMKSSVLTESRFVMVMFAASNFFLLVFARVAIFNPALKFLARYNLYRKLVLIIGAGKVGRLLAANLSFKNPYGLRILGFLDDMHSIGAPIFRGLKVIGSIDDLEYLTKQYAVDEIIVCVEELEQEKIVDVLERSQRTNSIVKIASPLYDIIPSFRFTEKYGQIPLIGLAQNAPTAMQELYKRIFDTTLAAFALVFLSPVLALLAIAIKIDSRGPIFYRQTRIGKEGKAFMFYKFRSMFVDSDKDESRRHQVAALIQSKGPNGNGSTKIVDESKVTKVGRLIRKTSLDELPQLFNVIKGDMSLVGPRPCLPYEWAHYEEWHKKRLSVMPGCTGVWQVSGRSSVGFNDMVFLDFYYIQNKSLFLDIQLIFKTIPVMVFGRGGK